MEQAILAMLGLIITLMLYLDRGRRADDAQIRADMNEGFAQIRADMHEGDAQIRTEMNNGIAEARAENAKLRDDMKDGFKQIVSRLDKLTDVVMDLCRRVGRLEGKAEALDPKPETAR